MSLLRAGLTHAQCGVRALSTSAAARGGGGVFNFRETDKNNANTPFEFTPENLARVKAIIGNYPVSLS